MIILRFTAVLALALASPLLAQSDSAFSAPLEVQSDGVTMRATLFVASGKGPHPTVVILKGFPGDNSTALPQYLQSRGLNAIALNFRGQHDSDGTYDVPGTATDAAALVSFLRTDAARRAFRVDSRHIAITGTSAGSFAALSTAAADESIACLALIVPFNWSLPLYDMRRSPLVHSAMAAQVQSIASRSPNAVRLDTMFVSRTLDVAERLDLRTVAARVKGRNVLMIGAERDGTAPLPTHFLPVRDTLKARNTPVRDTILADTHNLPESRDVVFDLIATWMSGCAR
jgi:dienelactone hydrolase